MSDEALQQFAKELSRDVEEGLSEIPFSEEVFTRLVLERLEEAGHLENTFPLYQEGRLKNAVYRIDGYSFDEEQLRLDLFTTIFVQDLPAARLATPDAARALERALRFASACVEGLAAQLEPSNGDASDLARLIESHSDELTSIRVILLTNRIVGNLTRTTEWRGRTVSYDTYDISQL